MVGWPGTLLRRVRGWLGWPCWPWQSFRWSLSGRANLRIVGLKSCGTCNDLGTDSWAGVFRWCPGLVRRGRRPSPKGGVARATRRVTLWPPAPSCSMRRRCATGTGWGFTLGLCTAALPGL